MAVGMTSKEHEPYDYAEVAVKDIRLRADLRTEPLEDPDLTRLGG